MDEKTRRILQAADEAEMDYMRKQFARACQDVALKCVVCLSPVERDKASICDSCWKQTVAGKPQKATPSRPFTLWDLRNIQEEMRQVPPLTPEQEARVREQLRGKKPAQGEEAGRLCGVRPLHREGLCPTSINWTSSGKRKGSNMSKTRCNKCFEVYESEDTEECPQCYPPPREHTTEIESKGLTERIEQILGLMKDSMTNLFALYPGDDFCISYTVVRVPPPSDKPPIHINLVTQGLAGKNPVDAWKEKGRVVHACPSCGKTLGWGDLCRVCMIYRMGETHHEKTIGDVE